MFTKEQSDILFKLSQENAQLRKETDLAIKELIAEGKKTEAQVQKTSDRVDRMCKLYGNTSNNQGDVAEEFYFNSLSKSKILNGITFDCVDRNVPRTRQEIRDEYDIFMINGDAVFIIEVKYKAHKNDLKSILDKKIPNFAKLYPEFKDYKQYFGLATFHISDKLKAEVVANHISVLQRSGDIIETTAGE